MNDRVDELKKQLRKEREKTIKFAELALDAHETNEHLRKDNENLLEIIDELRSLYLYYKKFDYKELKELHAFNSKLVAQQKEHLNTKYIKKQKMVAAIVRVVIWLLVVIPNFF